MTTAQDDRSVSSDSYKWKAFFAMALGLFAGVMDFGGVGVALPSIADDFGLALKDASLVVLAASLTISAVLLPVGGLSDRIGRKRSYMGGLALFAVGALGSAFAPGVWVLIATRVLQSAGSAAVMANGMAIVAVVFPPAERGKGMGLITTVVGIASITGPVVSGVMVDAFGWSSFFLLLAAVAVAGFGFGALILNEARLATARRGTYRGFDWVGAGISAAALGLFVVAVNDPLDLGRRFAAVMGAGAALLLAAFIIWELRVRTPMLNLAAFRNGQFSWAVSARFLGFLGGAGYFFLMPFYLQDVLGYAPSRVGSIMFPSALGMAVVGAFSGRLSDKFGVRPFTMAGLTMVVAGGLLLSSLDERSPVWIIMPALAINGIGTGLWVAPNMSVAISAVDSRTYGIIAAFLNLVRNTASLTGVAIAAGVVASIMAGRGVEADLSLISEDASGNGAAAFIAGARAAYLILVGFAVVAAVAAFKTREPRSRRAAARRDTTAGRVSEGAPGGGS